MTILIYIAEHEGCMKSDIYRDIVHNSSLPKRFDRLEEAGLIVQTRDDRATRLSLTAAGRQVAARLMEIRDLMVPRWRVRTEPTGSRIPNRRGHDGDKTRQIPGQTHRKEAERLRQGDLRHGGCGKSYLLFKLFRDHLPSEGVPESNIVSIALDDISNRDLRDAVRLYEHIASRVRSAEGPCHIILDEIQHVPDFQDAVNGLRHLEGVGIYITGSSSTFLSGDILTEFRGRGDEVRVRPLSFGEFRSAYPDRDVDSLWRQYMRFGGMPELVNRPDEEQKVSYLDQPAEESA